MIRREWWQIKIAGERQELRNKRETGRSLRPRFLVHPFEKYTV